MPSSANGVATSAFRARAKRLFKKTMERKETQLTIFRQLICKYSFHFKAIHDLLMKYDHDFNTNLEYEPISLEKWEFPS